MNLFSENTKKNIILIAAVLSFTIIQPGFVSVALPDVADRGKTPDQDKDINKNTVTSSIVAELNGVPISTQDLVKRYNLFLIMSGTLESSMDRVPVSSYLESYLTELLLIQEAKKMGISIGRDKVQEEKKEYLERNNLTEDEFLKTLPNFKLSMEDVDRYFENNLSILRLGSKKFGQNDISDKEAGEYYNKNKNYFNSPEKLAVSHILICHKDSYGCSSDLNKEQAKEFAENIRKLATPANFANLAKQFSTDRTGADGGDLGYITRGSAVPSFEKAVFKLGKGEISDVVETEFGYHIIYVRGKQKAISLTFEEAEDIIKKNLNENYIASKLFSYTGQLLQEANIKRFTTDFSQGNGDTAAETGDGKSGKKAISEIREFPTFKSTGKTLNVNSKGQPVILLFTGIGCSHCQWISETFDTTVMEYVEKGLIEAHHYELDTYNDLLTPVHEPEIPPEHLKIMDEASRDAVPYFNFGGKYDRFGNGYEAQDDFFAEEMEMRQVIEALLAGE